MYSTYADARDKKGLTDYKVAEITGIAQSTISDWKNGKSIPKADKLLLLANTVGLQITDLIKMKEN